MGMPSLLNLVVIPLLLLHLPYKFPFALSHQHITTTTTATTTLPSQQNNNISAMAAKVETLKVKGVLAQIFDSEEIVAQHLAKYIAHLSDQLCKHKGSFSVVLSGGSLIDTLRKLVEPPYCNSVDWSKWHIFWLDERVVAWDDKDSNYKLAYDGFLSKVPIPAKNIYAINNTLAGEGQAELAAAEYEARLQGLARTKIIELSDMSGFPKFDLQLVGMGPDGHVASLFPGHPLLHEKKRWVTFIKDSPKPPPKRITFTFPVINSSSNIALVVTGAELANAVCVALGDCQAATTLPVQMVKPEGELTWFLDKDAASKL